MNFKMAQDEMITASDATDHKIPTQHVQLAEKGDTDHDRDDMLRMGKTQELKRNFRLYTIFSFTMVAMATWEAQLNANIFGLINGGTAGLIWMYIGTFIGFSAAVVSMAEMASMAPTTGGQYHWVSEFAPRSSQQFLSYVVGWLTCLGWQVGNTANAFLGSQQIQGLMILNNDDYVPQRWHLTMLVIAIITFCQLFNTFLVHRLPLVEGIVLILHIIGFLMILVTLWICGEPSNTEEVFTTFTDGGGWQSIGLSCLIGMLSPIFSFIGPDSATHMAEELRNASYSLPRAMIATMFVNGSMGFVMLVTFCMLVGNVEEVLATETTQPFIQVFYNVTGSKAGATAMTCIMIIMSTFVCVTSIATSSRQVWAFARDRGLPFSTWLAHVRPGWDIPLNSVMFSYVLAILLSLINIGSIVAFNIISSLGIGALLSSYIVSISCVTLKRLRGEPLLPSRFSLGHFGLPLNVFSLLFLVLAFIMTFFPQLPHPEPIAMNWSILVYGSVVVFSICYFYVKGRYEYAGPVEYVKKRE